MCGEGAKCGSIVEHWPSVCEALDSILRPGRKRKIPRSPPHHHLLLGDRILIGTGSPPLGVLSGKLAESPSPTGAGGFCFLDDSVFSDGQAG